VGTDSYLLYARREGVSRAEVEDLLDVDAGDILWLADRCFAFWTGRRFAEIVQSEPERRIRLALQPVSLELFERIEPFAVAYADVSEFDEEDTLPVVLADPHVIRIDFKDFVPGDERFDAAEQEEARQMMASVEAMVAFSRHQEKDAAFAADMIRLADEGQVDALIARTRAVPQLAPLVDTLIKAKHFEAYIGSARMSRR
jgi:hypothetical protein